MECLWQLVIYDHPRDFPDWFVARWWRVTTGAIQPAPIRCLCGTLEEAREIAEVQGMCRMDRLQGDDPCILEVWI